MDHALSMLGVVYFRSSTSPIGPNLHTLKVCAIRSKVMRYRLMLFTSSLPIEIITKMKVFMDEIPAPPGMYWCVPNLLSRISEASESPTIHSSLSTETSLWGQSAQMWGRLRKGRPFRFFDVEDWFLIYEDTIILIMYILYTWHIKRWCMNYTDTWYSSYFFCLWQPGLRKREGGAKEKEALFQSHSPARYSYRTGVVKTLLFKANRVFWYSTIELCGEYVISYQIRILTCLFCFRHGLEFGFFFPPTFCTFTALFPRPHLFPTPCHFWAILPCSAFLQSRRQSLQSGSAGVKTRLREKVVQ